MSPSLPSDPPAAELRGKVLYIEDASINFAIVESMLARHPEVQLIRAATGHEGVRLARSERLKPKTSPVLNRSAAPFEEESVQ